MENSELEKINLDESLENFTMNSDSCNINSSNIVEFLEKYAFYLEKYQSACDKREELYVQLTDLKSGKDASLNSEKINKIKFNMNEIDTEIDSLCENISEYSSKLSDDELEVITDVIFGNVDDSAVLDESFDTEASLNDSESNEKFHSIKKKEQEPAILTEKEKDYLRENFIKESKNYLKKFHFSEKSADCISRFVSDLKVKYISNFVSKHSTNLIEFKDVVGDKDIVPDKVDGDFMMPSKLFFINNLLFGLDKSLYDDPEVSLRKCNSFFRRNIVFPLIKMIGPKMLKTNQVIENRKKLIDPNCNEPDDSIILPNKAVYLASNHHFKDDALASLLVSPRHVCIFFGSLPMYYNTIDGTLAYLNGSLLVNRRVKKSRAASISKAEYAIKNGVDVLIYIEGVFNKTINKLTQEYWHGIYVMAVESHTVVVPIIHYIEDPTYVIDKKRNIIHTVIDDPIDPSLYTEDEFLELLRDTMVKWYYLMMERYSDMSREELFDMYRQRAVDEGYITNPEDLSTKDIAEIYMNDLLGTVERYHSVIERSAHCEPKSIVKPEDVYAPVANLELSSSEYIKNSNISYARELVRTRTKENYQKRF